MIESVGFANDIAVDASNRLGSSTPTTMPTPSVAQIRRLLKRRAEIRRV